jgi:hypothetical protein
MNLLEPDKFIPVRLAGVRIHPALQEKLFKTAGGAAFF